MEDKVTAATSPFPQPLPIEGRGEGQERVGTPTTFAKAPAVKRLPPVPRLQPALKLRLTSWRTGRQADIGPPLQIRFCLCRGAPAWAPCSLLRETGKLREK